MSKIEWVKTDKDQWAARIDGKVRGIVRASMLHLSQPGCYNPWYATAIHEHSDTSTTRETIEDARQWVEDELTPALAVIDGSPAREAQLEDVLTRFVRSIGPRMERYGTEAELALVREALTLLRAPEPAPEETEEERAEREFQEARDKWGAHDGTLRDLCAAIRAGYEAGHTMYDDDMIGLAEGLTNNVDQIIVLAEKAGALLHAFGGDTPEFVRKQAADLEAALRGF